ncbi:hypothetical protein OV208_11190 [Corallococcus sp. bb12-1]|uniref:hypothetical protein n=1 Tax=Corallococcus sp. bb12-1 TaxID=2996784 RepID=UPI002271D819|nr:hypothetical protein [Corallococcus sp. bb12-1]MCY1041878.1 hypothetical protein [Corallococcus sp. bb12-1]
MPSLDTLLMSTLLLNADPRAPYTSFAEEGASAEGAARASKGAVWAWTHDTENPGRVTNVTHRLRKTAWFAEQTLTVLDELVWHPIEIIYRGTTLKLELTRKFLLRKYEVGSGSIGEERSLFWIPAELDRSMLQVFGFQVNLRTGSGTVELEPIPRDVLDREDFMPYENSPPPPKPPVMKVKRTETGTLQMTPLRVIVCAEFVCCLERADYVPKAKAATSRFRPHLMFVSNRPLERMAASISVRRPPMSDMAHPPSPGGEPHAPHTPPPHAPHDHDHAGAHATAGPPAHDPADDQDEMAHAMATGMWSDSNNGLLAWQNLANLSFPPLWNGIFSRVKTNLPAGSGYLMASPELVEGPGFNSYLFTGVEYKAWQQNLKARQGYFDNIHVAPPMKAPKSIRARLTQAQVDHYQLESIAMAPFCIHDCLHMHWRWLPADEKHLWGWDASRPYAIPGVPHIPAHQHLRVEVDAPHAFTYSVHADTCLDAGRWQYVMHEGMAYGNSAADEQFAKMMHLGLQLLDKWPAPAQKSWAMFYWSLRYWHTEGAARERLLEDGAQGLPYP